MPNSKQNQFWLVEDETDIEKLKKQIINIEQEYLNIEKLLSYEITNSREMYIKIKDMTLQWNFFEKNKLVILEKQIIMLEKRIIKNLESKKINSFKNFIIKFFTFGKINKNKIIKNEISKFISNYQDIKNRFKNINENLKKKTGEFLYDVVKQVEKQEAVVESNKEKIKELIQANHKLETKIEDNKEKIKQLESNIQQNKERIDELVLENKEYKKVQDGHNEKYINKFITLESMIKSKEEEISILKKEKARLEKEIKLRDFGIESALEAEALDFDVDSFNKNKINAQEKQSCNKKKIKARVVQIN